MITHTQIIPTALSRKNEHDEKPRRCAARPRLGLVAVGGMGTSALRELTGRFNNFQRVISIDTEFNALQQVHADIKIKVGRATSPRLGPKQVAELALAARSEIANALAGLDIVLLVTGMGGAAGTGISPVVAQVSRQMGIPCLSYAVVPFDFEGRDVLAQQGLLALQSQSPTLIVACNENFMQFGEIDNLPLEQATRLSPQAFAQLCHSIGGALASQQSNISMDIGDLQKMILCYQGVGAFGFGEACIADGVVLAVQAAMDHPLLGLHQLSQSKAVLVTVESSLNTPLLRHLKSAVEMVLRHVPPNAFVTYGTSSGSIAENETFRVSIWAQLGHQSGLGEHDLIRQRHQSQFPYKPRSFLYLVGVEKPSKPV